jgi:hypothetical protein
MSGLEDLTPQQRAHLALGASLMGNPETADDARRLLRKADPKFKAADLDLQDKLEAEKKAREDDITKLREERETDKRNAWYAEQTRKVSAAGLDLAKLEETMKTKKIADYDTAIEFMQSQQSMAEPTHESVIPMAMPDDKALWKDPKKTARDIAHSMINEFRGRRTA